MKVPYHLTDFQWENDNVEHIARHKVEPDEAEEVFLGQYKLIEHDDRFLIFGQTASGRYLLVVFAIKDSAMGDVIRVITAREMTQPEKRWYAKQKL